MIIQLGKFDGTAFPENFHAKMWLWLMKRSRSENTVLYKMSCF